MVEVCGYDARDSLQESFQVGGRDVVVGTVQEPRAQCAMQWPCALALCNCCALSMVRVGLLSRVVMRRAVAAQRSTTSATAAGWWRRTMDEGGDAGRCGRWERVKRECVVKKGKERVSWAQRAIRQMTTTAAAASTKVESPTLMSSGQWAARRESSDALDGWWSARKASLPNEAHFPLRFARHSAFSSSVHQ